MQRVTPEEPAGPAHGARDCAYVAKEAAGRQVLAAADQEWGEVWWVDEDEQNGAGQNDFSSPFGGMNDFDFGQFDHSSGEAEGMPKLDDMDSDSESQSEMDDESKGGSDEEGCVEKD
ncbi:hypothetical protein PORY_001324 [Pneumocystis oryctolagi]|uniref:Uncharacterized protein n=1 Tax=Pneumocystis oryctolagi TaxID=42067 RepID=A0ACB7CBP2_9ASCO|nr:hypothetical protein PORY_001324 [Pneumocystis oryctolagi]